MGNARMSVSDLLSSRDVMYSERFCMCTFQFLGWHVRSASSSSRKKKGKERKQTEKKKKEWESGRARRIPCQPPWAKGGPLKKKKGTGKKQKRRAIIKTILIRSERSLTLATARRQPDEKNTAKTLYRFIFYLIQERDGKKKSIEHMHSRSTCLDRAIGP